MKKVLIVASVISFIEWFNKENIEFLNDTLGCNVHVACNLDYMDDTDIEKTKQYLEQLNKKGVVLHNIHFARNPLNPKNIKALNKLKKIINSNSFDLIHCHTPTASILTRIAAKKARKNGTVVMYTCHGFHFHKASPKKNWLIYYPIEKHFSKHCDYIVTINHEDYAIAKTFKCENVRYIPGVGVDLNKITNCRINKGSYKESIGVPKDKLMLLSIGEMIDRKNHQIIIKALGKLHNPNIYYVICGKGPLKESLHKLAIKYGIANNVVFLGFRRDIPELCNAADIGAFPSKIEGLGLAGIEIMAAGVPLVSSNVHGILDYVSDGQTGFACNPNDVDGFAKAISRLSIDQSLRDDMKQRCLDATKPFDIKNALDEMWNIYREVLRV